MKLKVLRKLSSIFKHFKGIKGNAFLFCRINIEKIVDLTNQKNAFYFS